MVYDLTPINFVACRTGTFDLHKKSPACGPGFFLLQSVISHNARSDHWQGGRSRSFDLHLTHAQVPGHPNVESRQRHRRSSGRYQTTAAFGVSNQSARMHECCRVLHRDTTPGERVHPAFAPSGAGRARAIEPGARAYLPPRA